MNTLSAYPKKKKVDGKLTILHSAMPLSEENEEGDGKEDISVVEPASAQPTQPLEAKTLADTIRMLKNFCRGRGEFQMPEIIEEEHHDDSKEFDPDVTDAIARIAAHKLTQKHSDDDENEEEDKIEWWQCKHRDCKKWRKPPMDPNEECPDCEIDCDYCAQWEQGDPLCLCPASTIKRRKAKKQRKEGNEK